MKQQSIEEILITTAAALTKQSIKSQIHANNLQKVYGDDFYDETTPDNSDLVLDLLLVPPSENLSDSTRDSLLELFFDFICRDNDELAKVTDEDVNKLILSIIDVAEIIYDFNSFPSKAKFEEIYKTLNLKY